MNQVEQLKMLREASSRLAGTSSAIEKKKILAEYGDLKPILRDVYDPFRKFNVSSANVLKFKPEYIKGKRMSLVSRAPYSSISQLLSALNKREITGQEALAAILQFIEQYPDFEQEILNVLDKDLKVRMGASEINKVFKKLIPQFKVALANDYSKVKTKIDFEKDTWYASRKLDGVRCILIEEGGKPVFYSRQGKKFETLGVLAEEIMKIDGWEDFAFDGEICIVDEDDNETFSDVMKQIRKKDHTIPNPRYKIFDILGKEEFLQTMGTDKFSTRMLTMSNMAKIIKNAGIEKNFSVCEQWEIKDEDHMLELSAKASSLGWEGLILRKDVPYAGKRSNDMLKVKKFYDAEYKVIGVENGPFRFVNDGHEDEEEVVVAVHIKHKGYPVKVGSGFTLEQRRRYYADPDLIVGKQITVQYFEETTNKQGTVSLRFPTVKHVYEDGKRSV